MASDLKGSTANAASVPLAPPLVVGRELPLCRLQLIGGSGGTGTAKGVGFVATSRIRAGTCVVRESVPITSEWVPAADRMPTSAYVDVAGQWLARVAAERAHLTTSPRSNTNTNATVRALAAGPHACVTPDELSGAHSRDVLSWAATVALRSVPFSRHVPTASHALWQRTLALVRANAFVRIHTPSPPTPTTAATAHMRGPKPLQAMKRLCLLPALCGLNHSCNPNAVVFHSQRAVYALRDIAEGDELTIAYRPTELLRPAVQRWTGLGFRCECERCPPVAAAAPAADAKSVASAGARSRTALSAEQAAAEAAEELAVRQHFAAAEMALDGSCSPVASGSALSDELDFEFATAVRSARSAMAGAAEDAAAAAAATGGGVSNGDDLTRSSPLRLRRLHASADAKSSAHAARNKAKGKTGQQRRDVRADSDDDDDDADAAIRRALGGGVDTDADADALADLGSELGITKLLQFVARWSGVAGDDHWMVVHARELLVTALEPLATADARHPLAYVAATQLMTHAVACLDSVHRLLTVAPVLSPAELALPVHQRKVPAAVKAGTGIYAPTNAALVTGAYRYVEVLVCAGLVRASCAAARAGAGAGAGKVGAAAAAAADGPLTAAQVRTAWTNGVPLKHRAMYRRLQRAFGPAHARAAPVYADEHDPNVPFVSWRTHKFATAAATAAGKAQTQGASASAAAARQDAIPECAFQLKPSVTSDRPSSGGGWCGMSGVGTRVVAWWACLVLVLVAFLVWRAHALRAAYESAQNPLNNHPLFEGLPGHPPGPNGPAAAAVPIAAPARPAGGLPGGLIPL